MLQSLVRLSDDDAAVCARFGEVMSLREFITPEAYSVRTLAKTLPYSSEDGIILACWDWVANNISYPKSDRRVLKMNGKTYIAEDYWELPAEALAVRSSDCDGATNLLASLLLNFLPPNQVYATLGNLSHNGDEGHAWVSVFRGGGWHVLEATLNRLPAQPWKLSQDSPLYEPVIYFNHQEVLSVPEKTVCFPLKPCRVDFLRDYWCGCE